MRRLTSRNSVCSSHSNVAIFWGVDSWSRHCGISLAPCASEPDSCPTKGWRVVTHRTLVGVGCNIAGTPKKRNDGG
jgi:hypothetical protein